MYLSARPCKKHKQDVGKKHQQEEAFKEETLEPPPPPPSPSPSPSPPSSQKIWFCWSQNWQFNAYQDIAQLTLSRWTIPRVAVRSRRPSQSEIPPSTPVRSTECGSTLQYIGSMLRPCQPDNSLQLEMVKVCTNKHPFFGWFQLPGVLIDGHCWW